MSMSFCQQNVIGLLLFHVQDEPALPAWQSGQYYVDGTPKTSLGPTRDAAGAVHRGVAAHCDSLELTPKVSFKVVKVDSKSLAASLTCDLDCGYVATLDGRRALRGTAVGRLPKTIVWRGKVARGKHVVSAQATATVNPGPPGTGTRALVAR